MGFIKAGFCFSVHPLFHSFMAAVFTFYLKIDFYKPIENLVSSELI